MSDPEEGRNAAGHLAHSRVARFWLKELPYIAVLALTILGVAYTSVSQQPLIGYWEFLAVAIGLVCVTTGWLHIHDPKARLRMVWTQALHWLAFLVAMNIVLLPNVQRMLNAPATGLALLMLLALGTFVAGVHVSWHICPRHHHGALRTGDRMARRICSALALGGRSCYRDWHDIPVASERVANLEITPNQRLARLGGQTVSLESCCNSLILDFELGFNLQTYCLDVIHFDLPWKPSWLEQRNGRIDRKLQPAKQIVCRYVFYEQREADIMLEAPTQKTEFIRDQPKNGADRVKGLCLHARSRKSATQSGSLTRAPNWMTKSAGGMRGCCRSKTTCTVPSNDHESASA
jgi:hypothetical protein